MGELVLIIYLFIIFLYLKIELFFLIIFFDCSIFCLI